MILHERNATGLDTAGLILELLLTLGLTAPHCLDKAGLVLGNLQKLLVGGCYVQLAFVVCLCLCQQLVVYDLQHCVDFFNDIVKRNELLLARDAGNQHAAVVLDVARTDLQTYRYALHLVLAELPAGALLAVVYLDAQRLCKLCLDGVCLIQHAFLMLCYGNNNNLNGCYLGRQDQTVIVAVCHDDGTDHTGGNAPRGLVRILDGVVACGVGNAERSCKAVTEVVGGTALQRITVVHHGLNGIGSHSTRELFLLGLLTDDSGDCQHVAVEIAVDVQHSDGLLLCLFCSFVHGVALLPKELGGTQEGTGGLFPTHDVAPLVIQLGQVTVGLNDGAIVLAEQRFGGRTDCQTLGQLVLTANGDPSALGCKALNVILFLLKQGLGDQHGHVHVLVTRSLKSCVQILLDIFPDRIAVGTDDHAAVHTGIIHQLSLLDNVGVPLTEVNVHGCDLFNLFFFSHCIVFLV